MGLLGPLLLPAGIKWGPAHAHSCSCSYTGRCCQLTAGCMHVCAWPCPTRPDETCSMSCKVPCDSTTLIRLTARHCSHHHHCCCCCGLLLWHAGWSGGGQSCWQGLACGGAGTGAGGECACTTHAHTAPVQAAACTLSAQHSKHAHCLHSTASTTGAVPSAGGITQHHERVPGVHPSQSSAPRAASAQHTCGHGLIHGLCVLER